MSEIEQQEHSTQVKVIGQMPPYYKIAQHLWGEFSDFDSDGNASDPESTSWRELTLIKRPTHDQRLDIDPIDSEMNFLKIEATSKYLLFETVSFLQSLGAIVKMED